MVIEEKDFKIEKIKDGFFYNFSVLKVINKGKDNEREEFDIHSYGIPFDQCIKLAIDIPIRNLEGIFSVKEYIEKCKEIINNIGELIE